MAEAAPELVVVVAPVVFSAAAMDGSGKPSAGSVAACEELVSASLAEAAVVTVAGVVTTVVVAAAGAMTAVVAAVGSAAGFSSMMGCVAAAVALSWEAIGGGAAGSWSPEVVARVLACARIGESKGREMRVAEGGRRCPAVSI